MSNLLETLLATCEEAGASDLHLTPGLAPRFRIRGALVEHGGFKPFESRTVDELTMELGLLTLPVGCPDGTERVRLTLLREGALDGAVASPGGGRYRFNLFRHSGRHAIALRRLDAVIRQVGELGLPLRLEAFCGETDGLVIVTGPTGSGKSTTLAAMIEHVNSHRDGHVITIEDPIEYVHASRRCLVQQRQVGRDTKSFNDALVEALRQDPDVILVGEMRELETIRTALRAAETGHLVLATLHAGDCAGAVERLVSVFPSDEQPSVRRQLALVLRGILAQHLVATRDGKGRVPACELLVNTTAVANLIATGRSAQLYSALETGMALGMTTLDRSLVELVAAGRIDERAALALSRHPEGLRARLMRSVEGGASC